MSQRRFASLVALGAAATIAGNLAHVEWLVFLFKPATSAFISIAAWREWNACRDRYRLSIVVGLALSLAGDVFLMLPGNWFVHGLAAFLLAHIAYLSAFTSDHRLATRWQPFAAFALFAACMLIVLWPGLAASLRVPVLLYVVFLAAMTSQSVSRHMTLRTVSSREAAIGGILFLCSDALLAINKFHTPLPLASLWILGTYYAAQYRIAKSAIASPA